MEEAAHALVDGRITSAVVFFSRFPSKHISPISNSKYQTSFKTRRRNFWGLYIITPYDNHEHITPFDIHRYD